MFSFIQKVSHIHKEIYTCDNQLYQKQNGRAIAKHRTKNIHKSNRKALIFIKCSSHIKHNIPNTIIHENALYKKINCIHHSTPQKLLSRQQI